MKIYEIFGLEKHQSSVKFMEEQLLNRCLDKVLYLQQVESDIKTHKEKIIHTFGSNRSRGSLLVPG